MKMKTKPFQHFHRATVRASFEGKSPLDHEKAAVCFPNYRHLETKGLECYSVDNKAKNLKDLIVIFLPVPFLSLRDKMGFITFW